MPEYLVVYTGELYITVEAEDEDAARKKAGDLRDQNEGYFKVRDSYVDGPED